MAEIERKFLVEEMLGIESGSVATERRYLVADDGGQVRLRWTGGELLLGSASPSGSRRRRGRVPR